MSTDTRGKLIGRLEGMAVHPMAVMEREWPDVKADLALAARLLREDGERGGVPLPDYADERANSLDRWCSVERIQAMERVATTAAELFHDLDGTPADYSDQEVALMTALADLDIVESRDAEEDPPALAHPDAGCEVQKTGGNYSQDIPATREIPPAHDVAPCAGREVRETPTREDRLFALVASEVAHAAGMRPDDPPLEEHLDAAAAIIRRVRDDIASRSEGVHVPTDADEAAAMVLLGVDYLKRRAPERLTQEYLAALRGEEVGNG